MLSLTGEYALRAMIYLARHAYDWPIPGHRIAEQAGIPPRYLSKVLGDLVRSGVLSSSPGKSGGFRLRRSPRKMTLFEVLAPFEQLDRRRCPFGETGVRSAGVVAACQQWQSLMEAEARFLKETTVFDVALGEGTGDSDVSREAPG